MKLIATIAAILTIGAAAQADELILDLGSIHTKCETKSGKEYNNLNYGIGYAKTLNEYFALGVDIYNNSFDKTSVFVGLEATYPVTDKLALGIVAGGATGYEEIKHKTIVLIPAIEVKYDFGKNIIGVAQYTDSSVVCDNGVGVVHFQMRYRF